VSSSYTDRLALLDARDHEYIASLPESERTIVVSTIARYQREDSLAEGDPVPQLELLRADDVSAVQLSDLLEGKPALLIFGSYT